jgi:hypothetical protein
MFLWNQNRIHSIFFQKLNCPTLVYDHVGWFFHFVIATISQFFKVFKFKERLKPQRVAQKQYKENLTFATWISNSFWTIIIIENKIIVRKWFLQLRHVFSNYTPKNFNNYKLKTTLQLKTIAILVTFDIYHYSQGLFSIVTH